MAKTPSCCAAWSCPSASSSTPPTSGRTRTTSGSSTRLRAHRDRELVVVLTGQRYGRLRALEERARRARRGRPRPPPGVRGPARRCLPSTAPRSAWCSRASTRASAPRPSRRWPAAARSRHRRADRWGRSAAERCCASTRPRRGDRGRHRPGRRATRSSALRLRERGPRASATLRLGARARPATGKSTSAPPQLFDRADALSSHDDAPTTDDSYLAVVPAYNEASTVGERRALAPRARAALRRARGGRRLDRPHRDVARARRRDACSGCRSTSASAARCSRASATRSSTATTYMVQVDGDGQHDPDEIEQLLERDGGRPDVDMVCGSRFLTDDSGYPAPISRRTGHPPLRVRAVAHRRPARDRPDVRLPALQPARRSRCSRATTRTTTPRSRRC